MTIISPIEPRASQSGGPVRYNMGYVWAISLAAAMGGLMFGYDWIVISGTKPFYERYFQLNTAWQEGWAMGSALVGCLIGAILAGGLSDRFGRKRLLILSAVVFVVSAVGTALVTSFAMFNAWRILGGVAIGLASNLSPMYIAEVAPAAVRGRLVAMNQFTIVVGILLAQVANYQIDAWNREKDKGALVVASLEHWDSRRIAEELAWQVPRAERQQVVEQFMQLAKQPSGIGCHADVVRIVAELNAQREKAKLKTRLNAEDKLAIAIAGKRRIAANVTHGWRWMFGVTALPGCLFLLMLFFVPESPRWLVKGGQSARAQTILARIGGSDYARAEVANIQSTLVGEVDRVNFGDLWQPKMRWILLLGVTLAVLQQWCGINVIFYYAADLFRAAGYTVSAALFNIVIIGAVNLIFTIVAITSVDRFGRRPLMLIGFAGLATIHLLTGCCYFFGYTGTAVLGLMLAAIGCYGLSLAPVTWVVLSEIFPNRIRGAAMSVSVFALWTACFLLTYTYPLLEESLGTAGTFWIYAAICAGGLLFAVRNLPETKGRTLEELEQALVD